MSIETILILSVSMITSTLLYGGVREVISTLRNDVPKARQFRKDNSLVKSIKISEPVMRGYLNI